MSDPFLDCVPFQIVTGDWYKQDGINLSKIKGVERVETISPQSLKVIFEKALGMGVREVAKFVEGEHNLKLGARGWENHMFDVVD